MSSPIEETKSPDDRFAPEKRESSSSSFTGDSNVHGYVHNTNRHIITPQSPWYDALKPSSFLKPKENELGFDPSGMSNVEIAQNQLAQAGPSLSRRHLITITASAGIGTGLFVGTGNTLPQGGPAALIIGFGVMGIALIMIMLSTAELNLRFPNINPFSQLTARFLDPSWGFAIGWLYMFGYMVSAPLEMITAAELTQYWSHDNNPAAKVNPVAWISIIFVFDVLLHLFAGSRGYGELEFFVGSAKLTAMMGWMIYAVIYVAGGIPGHGYIGGKYYHEPGAFADGFKGVISVMVSASFAFGGTEISGVAAVETNNPVRSIPSSVRQTFWRIIIFFVTPVILVGFAVPYNTKGLGTSNGGSGSPFVMVLDLAGTKALHSIFNSVIICSVIGVSNSSIYASTRTLVALSQSGMAPKWLSYVDRRGRPTLALLCNLVFAILCFVSASDKYNDVFNWLYAFAQLAFLYVWSAICMCHIKFRLCMKRQGMQLNELLFHSPFGIPGAVLGGGIIVFVFALQFWTAAAPIGGSDNRASYFFQQDLSVVCAIVLYVGHKIYMKKTTGSWGFVGWDIDLNEGVRIIEPERLELAEAVERKWAKRNFLLRFMRNLC